MSSLKFFKGKRKNLPQNKQDNAFYLTEDTYDVYYIKDEQNPIKLFTDPKSRIKEIHTYYTTQTNLSPSTYPPPPELWSTEKPEDFGYGNYGAQVICTVYMDGHYDYSDVEDLIMLEEIDYICGVISSQQNTSLLGQAIIGEMILNTGGIS